MGEDEVIALLREIRDLLRDKPKIKGPRVYDELSPATQIRRAYFEAFEREFGTKPIGWGARENGQATQWVKSIPLQDALRLTALYPSWDDPYVSRAGHPFNLLIAKWASLDAWSTRADKLIDKVARGQAMEQIAVRRRGEEKELDFELNRRRRERDQDHDPTLLDQVPVQLEK